MWNERYFPKPHPTTNQPTQQPASKMSSNNKICFFCKNSGENEKTYTSHTKHTCQKLANIECLACGAKGHTERYCDNSGNKYTRHAKKEETPTEEWQEVSGGAKKTPLVFHVANNGAVVAEERPVTPPPPPKNDEETFPTLAEPVKPAAAKTLNFSALKFDKPAPLPVVATNGIREFVAPAVTVTSTVSDQDFPELPVRRTPPARSPPPLPTIREVNESDVSNMTKDEVVDTINSNITATEIAERTAQQLTSVVATLSTSLQLVNSRYDAKCKEYDALLAAYNALAAMLQEQQQTSQWGERGSSWADECN